MSKRCDLCDQPLNSTNAPIMNGEQRTTVWIVGLLSVCGVVFFGGAFRSCEKDKEANKAQWEAKAVEISAEAQVKIEAEKAEAARKVAQYEACLKKTDDAAICAGAIQTVRCLPPNK